MLSILYNPSETGKSPFVYEIGHQVCAPDQFLGPHVRDLYIAHYIVAGAGFVNSTRISAGQGFLIQPDTLVCYGADPTDPWEYYWIAFSTDTGDREAEPFFAFRYSARLFGMFDDLLSDAPVDHDTAMRGLLYYAYAHHVSRGLPVRQPLSRMGEVYTRKAAEYMAHRYAMPVRIQEVADYVGIDRQYLCNVFTRHAGVSPQRFLVRVRMDRARSLLSRTPLSVQEVARSVGYPDALQFSRMFRKHVGVSPLVYRNRARAGEA